MDRLAPSAASPDPRNHRAGTSTMNDADRATAYLPHLQDIPLLRDLSDEPARFIAGGSLLRCLNRGQILCEKGSRPLGFFCLLSGRVKLSALAPDGAERVLELVLPGRVFGQAASLLDVPHPLFAEVLCESRLLQIGRDRFQEAVARWPEVAQLMLMALAQDCLRLIHDLEGCCLLSASERLTDFLLKEAESGAQTGDSARVVLPASKALVASSLNLTAETFSRELHELARRGLIQVERRTLTIPSLARLRAARVGRAGSQTADRPVPSHTPGRGVEPVDLRQ